jgi:flagellar L-ring protein precursor FlgH
MKQFFQIQILIISLAMVTGCANFGKKMKAFLNDGNEAPVASSSSKPVDTSVKFSDTRDVPVDGERQYKRMSRKQFEDQELFSDNAGSLWVNEGQDSYLFAQNIVRLPGDILNVVLDGQPEKQLSTKAQVIKELTNRIERKQRGIASTTGPDGKPIPAANATNPNAPAQPAELGPDGKPVANANAKPGDAKTAAAAPAPQEKTMDEEMPDLGNFDVKSIPTRIVERLSDGNYRVKGAQTFMIGSKEYKVIVTGLVKPSDVADDAIASSKMLDSKFDIVRYNKGKVL